MRVVRVLLRVIGSIVLIVILGFIASNVWVFLSAQPYVYKSIEEVPAKKVALVLGTSHRLVDGSPNPFFRERMETTARLYKQNKVKHIIVSGDNGTKYYNEPAAMKEALLKLDIPEKAITMDFAGFRTLDSIVRCKKVFDQDDVTIITQPFHSYRAIFISQYYNMHAVAMATDKVDHSTDIQLREYLARTLAIWDLYFIKKGPKFLGEKETLDI